MVTQTSTVRPRYSNRTKKASILVKCPLTHWNCSGPLQFPCNYDGLRTVLGIDKDSYRVCEMSTVWKSIDGSIYEFSPHLYESGWEDVGGIYLFAARLKNGDWNPLFIGHSDSLEHAIPNHEKWPWAVLLGATHVLACAVAVQSKRLLVETEMIARLKPPLNSSPQGKPRDGAILRRA
jgi:hypothetical protein